MSVFSKVAKFVVSAVASKLARASLRKIGIGKRDDGRAVIVEGIEIFIDEENSTFEIVDNRGKHARRTTKQI